MNVVDLGRTIKPTAKSPGLIRIRFQWLLFITTDVDVGCSPESVKHYTSIGIFFTHSDCERISVISAML